MQAFFLFFLKFFSGSERTLGGPHAGYARIEPGRHVERLRERLEGGLGDVVVISTGDHMEMKIHLRGVGDRVEELADHLGVHLPDLRDREGDVGGEVGPAREVHRAEDQGLVHREGKAAVAADPGLVADRLADRGAEHDPDILDRVVGVDGEVAPACAGEVEEAVAREAVQHMVEEADPGVDGGDAGSVEVQGDGDIGLLGGAGDGGGAVIHFIRGHGKNSL